MNCSHNKRREISVMYEISTRTLQRYVDAYNECGMDAEPQGGLTYGLLPTTEDRATLGSDLSASWDFAGNICSLYLKLTSPGGGVSLLSVQVCRFVNDVLHIRESEKHLFRRAPVERTHREIVVFTLVNG